TPINPRYRRTESRRRNAPLFVSCWYYNCSKSFPLAKVLQSQPRAPPPHCAQNRHTMGTPAAAFHEVCCSGCSSAELCCVPVNDRQHSGPGVGPGGAESCAFLCTPGSDCFRPFWRNHRNG